MNWANRHVGIPWRDRGRGRDGCDCYGLVALVYREELGILLPDYEGYGSADETAEIAALVGGAAASPLWRAVSSAPAAFDVAVFRRGGLAAHLGIVIRPGLMLHMHGTDCAKVTACSGGGWGRRLVGHWRHRARADAEGGALE